MEAILQMREATISFYKLHQAIIQFILKFIAGFIIFSLINSLGFVKGFSLLPLILLCSLLTSVLPITFVHFIIILNITLQLFYASPLFAGIAFLFFLMLLFFYVRFAPKSSLLVIGLLVAFYFKIPFIVPIFAGLYFGLAGVIPIVIGTFIWYFIPFINDFSTTATSAISKSNMLEMPDNFSQIYVSVLKSVTGSHDWIFVAFVFAIVVVVVFVISKLSIDYAKDIAIVFGGVLNIMGISIGILASGINFSIVGLLFFSSLSVLIVLIIKFFDLVLDYSAAERVEFSDDENYYYVKVIPKIILSKPNREVRRISADDDDNE